MILTSQEIEQEMQEIERKLNNVTKYKNYLEEKKETDTDTYKSVLENYIKLQKKLINKAALCAKRKIDEETEGYEQYRIDKTNKTSYYVKERLKQFEKRQ